MNYSEIKDIDKLRNLLSEFDIGFEEMVYSATHEVNINSEFSTITFQFARDNGRFVTTWVE